MIRGEYPLSLFLKIKFNGINTCTYIKGGINTWQLLHKMVKELREKTGAGMMDCKKALTETDGDMEKAIDFLREKGIAKAAKKADRIAAEGLTSCCN